MDASAQSRSGIGVSLFPNYSNRRLVVYGNTSQAQIDSLEMVEGVRPSYSGGFFLSYRGEKVGVQAGLNYSENGFRGQRADLPITDPQASRFTEYSIDYRSRQIEVPFSLHFYQELTNKDEFFFMLGSGLNYNLQGQYLTTYYAGDITEEQTRDLEELRRLNFSFQTAMGWERALTDNWILSIAPTFRLWMAGAINDEFLDRNFNLYQLGLRVTVRWERELE